VISRIIARYRAGTSSARANTSAVERTGRSPATPRSAPLTWHELRGMRLSPLTARSLESDLQAAVGELAQVAAWIAYDADQQELARHLTSEALLHSRLAGDRRMELFELAQLAIQRRRHLHHPPSRLELKRPSPGWTRPDS
jgi:hypothetical protein